MKFKILVILLTIITYFLPIWSVLIYQFIFKTGKSTVGGIVVGVGYIIIHCIIRTSIYISKRFHISNYHGFERLNMFDESDEELESYASVFIYIFSSPETDGIFTNMFAMIISSILMAFCHQIFLLENFNQM
jgi:hypothetical protein